MPIPTKFLLSHNKPVEILGVSFNGVKDMIKHARDRMPKDGVYVGEDSQRYPCFDSSDSLYENRSYTNLVFASIAAAPWRIGSRYTW